MRGQDPVCPEILAPVLRLQDAWQQVLNRITHRQCGVRPVSSLASPLNRVNRASPPIRGNRREADVIPW